MPALLGNGILPLDQLEILAKRILHPDVSDCNHAGAHSPLDAVSDLWFGNLAPLCQGSRTSVLCTYQCRQ